jgi:AraC family transcriptional regulator, regulatory protein of adaptative response / methylated-DNA-[protein]-cysteine methyltransferase
MTIQKNPKTASTLVANDPRWAQIVARDRSADGRFWYSVATTGIYCRPSCPSRAANPKNVQLHDTLEEAKATGFRPCKRCNPDGLSVDAENALSSPRRAASSRPVRKSRVSTTSRPRSNAAQVTFIACLKQRQASHPKTTLMHTAQHESGRV